MYRVIAIIGGGLLLAACTSGSSFNLDSFTPAPVTDAVSFESEPAGADVKVGDQTCRTPCSLALPASAPLTAVFSLNGYQTEFEQLEVTTGNGPPSLRPNPVTVELTPAPPAPVKRKPAPKKKPAAKPAPRAAAPAPAAAPAAAAPPPATAAPWPTAPR